MRITSLALLLGATLLAPGCHFYFGGDDGDDDCTYPAGDDFIPEYNLRNPYTGQCEYWGGGGGWCDGIPAGGAPTGNGGPGYADLSEDKEAVAFPDYATCNGACDGLDEYTCMITDACRAVYATAEACGPEGCAWVREYSGCWGTAPSGPIRGGSCEGLDAWSCSQHDDCSAVHDYGFGLGSVGGFNSCVAENLPCAGGGSDPGGVPWPGTQLRDPVTGKCQDFGGGGCLPAEGGGDAEAPLAWPDWGYCESYCTGLDEASCKAADGCRAIFANACPPNADCFHLVYTECWQTAMSGPVRGGDCTILDAYECSRHDDCVAEHDSDWSQCNDLGMCDWTVGNFLACNAEAGTPPPPPPPACADITDEDTCIASMCTPLYEGSDCSCTPMGCTCSKWTFVDCT